MRKRRVKKKKQKLKIFLQMHVNAIPLINNHVSNYISIHINTAKFLI